MSLPVLGYFHAIGNVAWTIDRVRAALPSLYLRQLPLVLVRERCQVLGLPSARSLNGRVVVLIVDMCGPVGDRCEASCLFAVLHVSFTYDEALDVNCN